MAKGIITLLNHAIKQSSNPQRPAMLLLDRVFFFKTAANTFYNAYDKKYLRQNKQANGHIAQWEVKKSQDKAK